ncbi:MAG: MBL fold metallo-hydrolase [Bacillota bacterium]|nr:MBL fold metallo-hydrolase [Bacillota bacterium]
MEFTTFASGSSGNCLYIRGGRTKLLVDAGCSMRHIKNSLEQLGGRIEELAALLITHEHSDHIQSAAALSRRYGIPIYASAKTWEHLPFGDEFFPFERNTFDYGMSIGEIAVDFFRLSHDAAQPVGMVFSHDGQRLGVVTDTGKVTAAMLDALAGSDALVLEANHDLQMLRRGPYTERLKQRIESAYGHLSNEQAGDALVQLIGANTQAVLLSHLSAANNTPELAFDTVCAIVEQHFGHIPCNISVAPRKAPHPLICIEPRGA